MRLIALLAMAAAVAFPARAAIITAVPAGIPAAIAIAHGGDTIMVAGPPAAVVIRNKTFSPPVTITSAAGGLRMQLISFQVSSVTGLRLVNADVRNPAPVSDSSPIVFIQSSHSIDLVNLNVSGGVGGADKVLYGKLISVADSDHVTITGGDAHDGKKGVSLANAADVLFQGMAVHHVRTSPFDAGGELQRVRLVGNHIYDIVPVAKYVDHSDGIHFFLKNSLHPADAITVQGNRLEMTNAPGTLGINFEGIPAPSGFTNLHVVGNILAWNNNQGITTNWILSGEFTGNVLMPAMGLDNPAHAPGFVFRNSGPAVTVTGNTSKDGPSMKPYRVNTFLTAAQIAVYLAKP